MKLDLGCSFHKRENYLGVDILRVEGVDVLADAQHLPFKDSSIEGIYSSHCIEHIPDQLKLISELWRVCADDAKIHILVPHFSNPSYYDDLTHQHRYSTRSFEHYDQEMHQLTGHPNYLPNVNFKPMKIRLNYWPDRTIEQKSGLKRTLIRNLRSILNHLANSNQFICERFWCGWVGGFFEVEYVLLVKKK